MSDLRVEAFSLIVVRATDSSIIMSKAEVQVIVEGITGVKLTAKELSNLPGTDEPSVFEQYFDEPEDETEDEP